MYVHVYYSWKRAHMCTERHVCFGRTHSSQLREGVHVHLHSRHTTILIRGSQYTCVCSSACDVHDLSSILHQRSPPAVVAHSQRRPGLPPLPCNTHTPLDGVECICTIQTGNGSASRRAYTGTCKGKRVLSIDVHAWHPACMDHAVECTPC
jgi:hypothetical protein